MALHSPSEGLKESTSIVYFPPADVLSHTPVLMPLSMHFFNLKKKHVQKDFRKDFVYK
jgi:hypothetical protein